MSFLACVVANTPLWLYYTNYIPKETTNLSTLAMRATKVWRPDTTAHNVMTLTSVMSVIAVKVRFLFVF